MKRSLRRGCNQARSEAAHEVVVPSMKRSLRRGCNYKHNLANGEDNRDPQ